MIATHLPGDGAGPIAPAIPAEQLAERARQRGLKAHAVDDPVAAIHTALGADGGGPIVVTGSFLHLAAADAALAIARADRTPGALTADQY